MGFSNFEEARKELAPDLKALSERRGETMKTYFAAALAGLGLGGTLVGHALYARSFGVPLNGAELGGGAVFALFGLAMAYGGVHEAIVFSGVHAVVALVPQSPKVGQEVRVEWIITGKSSKLATLRIELVGDETVVTDLEERGWQPHGSRIPNKVTVETFATLPVVELQAPIRPRGSVKFTVPADARPSSVSANGGQVVDWGIHVVGQRTNRLRFEDDYPVTIRPA
jgi:hypothetical protein